MAGDDSFLSRWARRKSDARQGKPPDEPLAPKPAAVSAPVPQAVVVKTPAVVDEVGVTAPPPALTLDDANALQQDSDFKPFMAQQVQPEVRNAAMKKLFADPHYNVMDGLDIYIDDYTQSDPIPESMLRQMVGAQFLKLFDHELTTEAVAQSPDLTAAFDSTVPPPAQAVSLPPPLPPDHDHTHLRLQPDHAPAGPGAERGAA